MKTLFELELTRNDVTPAQFLAYVRRMCKAHGIDCFEMSARDFAAGQSWGNDEYMNTRYVGGTPSTRPCESEICKATPYDHQTYIHNFDGSVYNEIIEFTFDDEKTGHGYFFTVQTETDEEHRAEDTARAMESIANYHRNMTAGNERKIERKRRELADIERNIANGWAGDHAHYWAESIRFEIEHLERENAEHAAAIEEAEAEIEKITEAATEAENAAKHAPGLDKVLTYAELIELAKRHYNEGGDGIVECWSERDFDEYVKECGPVTLDIALSIMGLYDEVIKEEVAILFGNSTETEQTQETTYKVVMVSMGGTRRDMFTGLTSERAHEICEDYGWEVAPDGPGSYVWDLEIEEDDST